MKNNIQPGGLYRIKDGKSVCETEEFFSPYVRFIGYTTNPLSEEEWYIEFLYVYENLEPTTNIYPMKILPYDIFFENFELYLDTHKVNDIIRKHR